MNALEELEKLAERFAHLPDEALVAVPWGAAYGETTVGRIRETAADVRRFRETAIAYRERIVASWEAA